MTMSKNIVKLGDYISEYSVRNKGGEDIQVYSVTNTNGFCTEYFDKDVASKDQTNYKIVPRGYFAYNPSRVNVGSIDYQNVEERVVVSPLYVVFKTDERIDNDYLLHYLKSEIGRTYINELASGSVRANLKFSILQEFPFPMVSLEEQREKMHIVRKMDDALRLCDELTNKLDDTVKSRFIEMFGDPVENNNSLEIVPLSELAEIKIGPFGSLLHKEDYVENGHPLVNPTHIVDGRVITDDNLTVTDEKYDELKAYWLKQGDVVMGRRGEMGRCAVVECDGMLCGTGSLFIRSYGEVTADYIQKIISFPSFKMRIEDMAVGGTMQNLNVPIVSSFQIPKPSKELQEQYYAFVEATDKSKLAIKNIREKIEILKEATMQEYFG